MPQRVSPSSPATKSPLLVTIPGGKGSEFADIVLRRTKESTNLTNKIPFFPFGKHGYIPGEFLAYGIRFHWEGGGRGGSLSFAFLTVERGQKKFSLFSQNFSPPNAAPLWKWQLHRGTKGVGWGG